jgi:hypothetical protein
MSSLKICFFQITNSSTEPYSKYSTLLNKRYCDKHGYDFKEYLSEIDKREYHYTWCKIFQAKKILETENYDFIFFLDADAIIINTSIKLEEIILKMKTDISFSENGVNGGELISTGAFLASKNTLKFFDTCIELVNTDMQDKKFNYWHELAVINRMYEEGWPMDIFDMNIMNSYGSLDVNHLGNQFLFHFQGKPDEVKTTIAEEIFKKYG